MLRMAAYASAADIFSRNFIGRSGISSAEAKLPRNAKSTLYIIIERSLISMETMQNILTRRSVRKFADKPIEPDKLHTILEAAMSGPCAVNAREWAFIVVTDREKLAQMAEANGRVARMLNQAAAAILVCGDLDRAFPPAPDFWVIDAAIAAQNMTLAANDLGIGSVWLGTWPDEKRVKRQAAIFQLPETIVPHSILALGYPAEDIDMRAVRPSRYEENRVHVNQW
ncbi:MAG: nitroreductase family protein [Clostridiales bacterium]|nr:nitroreductase family protein [Clostridiales bacterium]MBD9285070.1 nitroreductase family protein [Clostridiales bacterium]